MKNQHLKHELPAQQKKVMTLGASAAWEGQKL